MARRFDGPPITAVAEELGVSELIDAPPPSYSTGELRRAEICLAVVRKPACLIADEPLRGIDPIDAELVLAQFRSMASAGCAVVISGHHVAGLMDVVDSVVWVTSGTSYVFASSSEATGDDQFRREYLTGNWT
jgi:ABC-type multidrug transport system ATPase subunit